MLVERDEALKAVNSDKSSLELEAEGFAQRLRSLDESEQRYKDENWSLETQLQELNAASREAANREQKLHQSLTAATSEKNAAQGELDSLRQDYTKIEEDYTAMRKTHESELASLRKSVILGENEKGALQRKIEELTSQNRELANGLAGHFRDETEPEADVGAQSEEYPLDLSEREHSPPPSPTKGVQRHSMLESETLKSSLHHAHRMIQNLKGNVHREKTEKQDLKRMLQEARDELEIRRAEPREKRLKPKSQQDMNRTGRPGLGATRNSRTDVMVDDFEQDPNWEDHVGDDSPRQTASTRYLSQETTPTARLAHSSDAYQTANETEDAFETADERDTTDNEAFQTGAESMAGDSTDDMTETESGMARGGTVRGKRATPLSSARSGDRRSIQSTASTSDDDEDRTLHTPLQGQPQRLRLRMNRSSRRSRIPSEIMDSSNPLTAKDSPANHMNGGGLASQSLFNELENLSGDDNEGTPSKGSISSPRSTQSLRRSLSDKRSSSSMRRNTASQPSTPSIRPSTVVYAGTTPPVPRIPTVSSGMMTDPWEPTQRPVNEASPIPASSGTLPQSSAAAIASRIFGSTPSTPQNKVIESQPASGSHVGSTSRSTSTSPRPVWDQPLPMFSGIITGFNQSPNTTPLSTRSATSQAQHISQDQPTNERQSWDSSDTMAQNSGFSGPKIESQAVTPSGNTIKAAQSFTMSPIHSVETAPISPVPRHVASERSNSPQAKNSPVAASGGAGTQPNAGSPGSIFGSVFGWNKPEAATNPQIAEDETSQRYTPATESAMADSKNPLQEVPANAINRIQLDKEGPQSTTKSTPVYMADHGAQTLLSSEQIDSLLNNKDDVALPGSQKPPAAAVMKPLSEIGAVSPPASGNRFPESAEAGKGKAPDQTGRDSLGKSFKRPTSMRPRVAQYPPLPPDHQEAIAAAAQKSPSTEVPPTSIGAGTGTSMGPPLVPASAYPSRNARSRANSRPQTPSQQGLPSPSSRGGTTPRAGRYSTTRSQVSHRSSVSSFASELDERFNIRTDGMPMPQGIQSNTDPRMIQAITQTMIGEMMWKYTRKAGRGEMSSSRHRRFFWVHPYTRTLYWSDRDPASANRAELKSKSVAIEAVRVVTDDNPMPPGLHRKSLIIITPGRSVKFTAQTSQRHETWFNALSYLLLRTGPEGANSAGDLTDADVDEFNPQSGYSRRSPRSRVSLASFRSHSWQNRQDQNRLSTRVPTGAAYSQTQQPEQPQQEQSSVRSRISRSLSRNRGSKVQQSPPENNNTDSANTKANQAHNKGGISTRVSSYLHKPSASVRSSIRSRSSMRNDDHVEPGVLEGGRSVVSMGAGDSAEDLRRVIEEREREGQGGRLENVRSCCDGKSTLNDHFQFRIILKWST